MRLYFLLLALPLLAFSQPQYRYDTLRIFPTTEEMILDGKVNEPLWVGATSLSFHEYNPSWGDLDTTTAAWITFDEQYLYYGIKMQFLDESDVIARNLVRDGWQGDDFVTLHIDTYGDSQNALVFSMYPLGSRYDMAVSNDAVPLGSATFNRYYDMIWEGKSYLSENGLWQAEYRIPLSNLRFREVNGRVYSAIGTFRTRLTNNATYIYPKVPQEVDNGNMKPSLKQPVNFVGLKPRKQLLITPYGLGGIERTTGGSTKSETNRIDGGLDVRYGLSPKVTLDLTYNTDFSQVEADDQVINLNRTSIFFPERRRFFQEQAGLYEMGLGGTSQLFYSRRIGINSGELIPILGGARLNGKMGDTDIGLLNIQTQEQGALPGENFSALRLRKKVFNDRSFMGMMGTSRIASDENIINIGADALIELNQNRYLQMAIATGGDDGWMSVDRTRAYLAFVPRNRTGFLWTGTYAYSGQKFNPGVGFVDRADFHNPFVSLQYGVLRDKKEAKRFRYSKWTFLALDQFYGASDGELETIYTSSGWEATNFRGDAFDLSHITQHQVLEDTLRFSSGTYVTPGSYTFNHISFRFFPAPQGRLQHGIFLSTGKFYDGSLVSFRYAPSYQFNKHLNVSGRYQLNRLDFEERNQLDWVHILKLRAELALNLHLSGSYIFQYNSDTDRFIHNARARYNFSDGHDLYFVYNSMLQDVMITDVPVQQTLSTFILKYTYTFFR